MKKFEQEFRKDHPETIGETDSAFDNSNYIDWLEEKLSSLQSKGKTKEDAKEDLRSAFGYYSGIGEVDISEEDIDDDFEKWYEQYAQSHANKDGWVRVDKDNLPQGEVLLLTSSVVVVIGDWYIDGWRTHQLRGLERLPFEDITHWQPLPPKPQI